jgi:hypothetical protein
MKLLIMQSSLASCHFLHQNVLLSNPSITQSMFFLLDKSNVSHPYKTIGRIMVLYISMLTFFDTIRVDKRFLITRKQPFPEMNLLLIFFCDGNSGNAIQYLTLFSCGKIYAKVIKSYGHIQTHNRPGCRTFPKYILYFSHEKQMNTF